MGFPHGFPSLFCAILCGTALRQLNVDIVVVVVVVVRERVSFLIFMFCFFFNGFTLVMLLCMSCLLMHCVRPGVPRLSSGEGRDARAVFILRTRSFYK